MASIIDNKRALQSVIRQKPGKVIVEGGIAKTLHKGLEQKRSVVSKKYMFVTKLFKKSSAVSTLTGVEESVVNLVNEIGLVSFKSFIKDYEAIEFQHRPPKLKLVKKG